MADTVCIAYLRQHDVAHSWHESYTASLLYDARPGGPRHITSHIAQFGQELSFDSARNKVAKHYLDEYDSDWLWWTDSDMGWHFTALEQLLAVADPVERPIVGGLCFGNSPVTDDGANGHVFHTFPTVYLPNDNNQSFTPWYGYPVNEVVQVAATGSAFILIHRSVLVRIREEFGDTWYDRSKRADSGEYFGEDMSFCIRSGQMGIPIYVHTGVRTNHQKVIYLTEDYYLSTLRPQPAIAEVAVLVPVMERPNNAEPFMATLRASTGLAHVYAIADPDDLFTRAAWEKAGATVLVQEPGRSSFAQKVNDGYRQTAEPWLFLAGDDVRFTPGWLDHAEHVAYLQSAAVVGTNDNANPRVMSGAHATHMLIDRTYIDDVGASWDGPGTVCHEGYGHWFVDDEIVNAAKQRGVFAPALGSIVEHLHPITGRVATDPVYEKGQASAKRDREHFKIRLAKHTEKMLV